LGGSEQICLFPDVGLLYAKALKITEPKRLEEEALV
jgi:hypothetical protein